MRAVLAALCVCGLAGAAFGQPIDRTPDGIGVYFDAGATEYCFDALEGGQVLAYLCLTRASDNSGFLSWEATVEGSVGGWYGGAALMGDAVNSALEPEFVVSFNTPLPYAQSTVLAEFIVNVVWEWSIALRVMPASDPSGAQNLPVYTTTAEPGVYKPLQYLWGWDGVSESNWSASINDPGCVDGPSVDADDSSWGGIKALYR